MSDSAPKKIGGEYGEIRASINVDNLSAYLAKNTPMIKTPVDVKQFKVRKRPLADDAWLISPLVRPGMNLGDSAPPATN